MATYPLVYFVRHGETSWNADSRLQGQADTDINAKGRAQATRNGEALARLIPDPAGFDFVASPLRRTRETMERVRAAMGLDPQSYRTDARLKEVHFGDWQGYTYAEMDVREPGSIARYQALSEQVSEDTAKIAEQQERLRASLVARFAKAETRISASKSTLSFLQAQIDAWNAQRD